MSAAYASLTPRHLREFCHCKPELKQIFHLLAALWPDDFNLYITCIHRRPDETIKGESGVHNAGPPFRAIDVRIRNLSPHANVSQEKAEALAERLNNLWVYDPKRPHLDVAVAKLHGTGPHIHLQVHPRTAKREILGN
jgi:hypothetical protein